MTQAGHAKGGGLFRRSALVAALAVIIGLAAAGPRRLPLQAFVLLVGLAGALVAAGVGFSLPAGPPDREETRLPGRRTLLGAAAGSLLAVVLLAASLRTFAASDGVSRAGWILFLLALLALGGAFFLFRGAPPDAHERVRGWEIGGLLVVLAVAAAFRLHELRSLPYGVWFDEAENTRVVKRILEEPAYRPVFVAEASKMPALAFYVFEPFVKVFPERALGVRVAATCVGLLAVVATWLLGRELFGGGVGLLAAGILAVSRWHVDFSRFGMAIIFSTAAAPLVLFLLLRSQRLRSARDAVLSGLALGLGIQLYYSLIVLPVLIGAWGLVRLVFGERRRLPAAGLLALTLAAGAFAYAPLGQFARRHPGPFAERFRATVALNVSSYADLARVLLKPSPERSHALEVLEESLVRHLKMFHYVGDSNGRHNLPQAPMLEAPTGVLFGAGFFLCLLTLRDRRSQLLLLAFGAFFAAGVLSIDFEAPQAARTLGLLPFACVLAALPLAALGKAPAAPEAVRGGLAAVAIGLVAWSGVESWRTFFHVQPFELGAFAAWSTQETKVGDVVAAEGRDAAVFVPPQIVGGPTLRLLAGESFQAIPFLSGRDLPLETGGRRAIVFLGLEDPGGAALIRNLYPAATFESFKVPRPPGHPEGPSILTIARVPAAAIADLRGWSVTLVSGGREDAMPGGESTWDWSQAALRPPFTARVRGRLLVKHDGPYTLAVSGAEGALLRIDGGTLLSPGGPREVVADLARGTHDVALDVVVSRPGKTSLTWGRAGAAPVPIPSSAVVSPRFTFGGLLGSYARGLDARGTPAFRRIDPQIAVYFHELPVDRPFSIRWTGTLLAPEDGEYTFSTTSIDTSTVALDGREILRNPGALQVTDGAIRLGKGPHALEVTFQNQSDFAQIFLSWVRPGREREIVPADVLRPPPVVPLPPAKSARGAP